MKKCSVVKYIWEIPSFEKEVKKKFFAAGLLSFFTMVTGISDPQERCDIKNFSSFLVTVFGGSDVPKKNQTLRNVPGAMK